jgi:hypothetical protein
MKRHIIKVRHARLPHAESCKYDYIFLYSVFNIKQTQGITLPEPEESHNCKRKTINEVTSGGYALSTKTVDNPVEAVDMFLNCHIISGALSVCILNKHGI